MQKKVHIKKGDTVYVNSGEYKGRQGRVLEVDRKSYRAIVEGVNIVLRHTKPNNVHREGGRINKEAPIHISNLMLIDPISGEPTRIGRRLNNNNKLVRYAKKIKRGDYVIWTLRKS